MIRFQDFLPYDVEMFKNGHINITGFQILARESIEYDNLKRFIHQMNFEQNMDNNVGEDADLQARLALAHDAILVAKTALEGTLRSNDSLFHQNFRHGEMYNKGFPGIYCFPEVSCFRYLAIPTSILVSLTNETPAGRLFHLNTEGPSYESSIR